MATLIIRNLDDDVKERIRIRGAQHGQSMEAEARDILTGAVEATNLPEKGLATWIRTRLAEEGLLGLELEIPRHPVTLHTFDVDS